MSKKNRAFSNLSSVAPVAWMIIFGDGLHNFIDGLSIGVAFTDTVLNGIRISLAVLVEEFPHKLGKIVLICLKKIKRNTILERRCSITRLST